MVWSSRENWREWRSKCALLRGVDPKSDVLSLPTIIPQNTGDSKASVEHWITIVYRYGDEVPVRQPKHVLKYDSRELSHATRLCGIFLPVQNRVTTKRHPNRITWSCITLPTESQQMGMQTISDKAAARPEGVFFSTKKNQMPISRIGWFGTPNRIK